MGGGVAAVARRDVMQGGKPLCGTAVQVLDAILHSYSAGLEPRFSGFKDGQDRVAPDLFVNP